MPTLLPDPTHLQLDLVHVDATSITVLVASTATSASCPLCDQPSDRPHSRYVRTLADLPWAGVAVRLQLTLQRFFCDTPDCQRRIFAERLPAVAAPYARRTLRLADAFELIGLLFGGEGGARALTALAMDTSPDTILRTVRAAELPDHPTPRVLGVDDFSFRRGKRFGTILIDLERRCRIDLLPDRTAATLAQWLAEHPGVEVISRDRGGAYAEGARAGAADAVQVADRFHVVANLREALERLLTRNHRWLEQAAALQDEVHPDDTILREDDQPRSTTAPPTETKEPDPPRLTRPQREAVEARSRRIARYEQVQALREQGMSIRAIARQLGLSRQTVTLFAQTETFPERRPRSAQSSNVDRYEEYLRRRWNEGCQNAAQLWRELRDQGFPGSRSAVRRWLARWRIGATRPGPPARDRPTVPAPSTSRTSSPRQASWLLIRQPDDLESEDRIYLEHLRQLSSEVATIYDLAQEFGRLVREHDHPALEQWLEQAEQSQMPELIGFAAGIRRDQAAVEHMLLTAWSNGQVEGQVNRLKLLKRQMYGRAKFDLLRKRVLYAA